MPRSSSTPPSPTSTGPDSGTAWGRSLATGVHDEGGGFTEACFHTAGELAAEARAAGFAEPDVRGVEGPA